MKSTRFDYVQYDQRALDTQGVLRNICEELETHINSTLDEGRAKSLALTKLEEVYMWIGKAIRDDQLKRNS